MRGVKVAARALLTVTVLCLAGMGVTAALAHHQGYRPYVVHTGSMVPDFRPGDLLIDAPPTGPFVKGDLITFAVRAAPGLDRVVTHRVHAVHDDKIITKGDANRTPDTGTRTPDDVVGEVAARVPHAGYLLVFLKQPGGVLGVLSAVAAIMLAWSLFYGDASIERERHPPAGHGELSQRSRRRTSGRPSTPVKGVIIATDK